MKISKIVGLALGFLGVLFLTHCSSIPAGGTSAKEIAATGPTIINERVVPKTIELSSSLQPIQAPEIVADVKDFTADISTVKLRFLHVPIEVPMKNIGGTTWRATLTPQEIKNLAVSGETITYDANIVARDNSGRVASSAPLTLAIKAPDLAKAPG